MMASAVIQWTCIVFSLVHLLASGQEILGREPESLFPNRNKETLSRVERTVLQLQNDDSSYRDKACPPVEMIEPCDCTLDEDMNMDMDCSTVENEDQLAQVFDQDFPFLDFRQLKIQGYRNLKVLRADTFGNATFQQIYIRNSFGLEEVQNNTFASSYLTAEEMDFTLEDISLFPFEEINSFVKLQMLDMSSNNLTTFPTIVSSSLVELDLALNDFNIENIGNESLQQLPKLEKLHLSSTGLTEIYEGTFTRLPSLTVVFLFNNQLTHLPDGIVDLHDNYGSFISLENNAISSVAPNAITGVRGSIFFEDNLLTKLEEDVWRKHLEKGGSLWMARNPLECGCDIAWIILNKEFLHRLDEEASCADGTLLTDLDPNIYAEIC